MSMRRILVALGLSLFLISSARADSDADLEQQKERQKHIQAETDQVVRRMGTMLRVLEYYEIDQATEKKMLEDMAGILAGLSKNQMSDVIKALDAAAKTPDESKSKDEIARAYARHREIVDSLKDLLARHDAVRNLDQAADRLDKMAKTQLELHMRTGQFMKDLTDRGNPYLAATQRMLLNQRLKGQLLEGRRQG